jgi:type IV secretory pathway VirB2 component (pilin)
MTARRLSALTAAASFPLLLSAARAQGSLPGGGLPWDGVLETIVADLQGPTARLIATILLIVLGFLIAFGEVRGFFALFIRVAFGLSLVFAVSSWLALFRF